MRHVEWYFVKYPIPVSYYFVLFVASFLLEQVYEIES